MSEAMRVYEIINPSDPYTFLAPDDELAKLLCLLVGRGQYGIEGPNGENTMCLYILGIDDTGLLDLFNGRTFQEVADARRPELPAALRSVLICSRAERAGIQATLEAIPEEGRTAFLAKYHDTKRSSLNDIGGRCGKLADVIKAELAGAR